MEKKRPGGKEVPYRKSVPKKLWDNQSDENVRSGGDSTHSSINLFKLWEKERSMMNRHTNCSILLADLTLESNFDRHGLHF